MKLEIIATKVARSTSLAETLVAALQEKRPESTKANAFVKSVETNPAKIELHTKPFPLTVAGVSKPVEMHVYIADVRDFDARHTKAADIKVTIPSRYILSSYDLRSKLVRILLHELAHAFDRTFDKSPADYYLDTPTGPRLDRALHLTNKLEQNAFLVELTHAFADFYHQSDEPSQRRVIESFLATDFRAKELLDLLPDNDPFLKRLYKALYAYASSQPGSRAREHFDRALDAFAHHPRSGHLQSDVTEFVLTDPDAQAYAAGAGRADKIKRLMRAIVETHRQASQAVPIDHHAVEAYVDTYVMRAFAALRPLLSQAVDSKSSP